MRQSAFACAALAILLGTPACGGDGGGNGFPDIVRDTTDNGGGDAEVLEETDATPECTEASQCTGLSLDACEQAACVDNACVKMPITDCCTGAGDCASLTLGTCEIAACVDNACVAQPDPACCDTAADCTDLQLGVCQIAACVDGQCVADDKPDCCEQPSDCTDTINNCETHTCVQNVCGKQTKPDCCLNDAACGALGDGCCNVGKCGIDNKCKVDTLTECCEASSDCDDGNPNTQDVCLTKCVSNGCDVVPPVCELNKIYTSKDFDDGTLQALKPKDNNTTDKVVVSSRKTDAVSPPNAAYFGDPECNTYFNGPKNADCTPTDPFANGSTPVSLELETPEIALDASAGAIAGFWLKMAAEPALTADLGNGPVVFDTDVLKLIADDGNGTEVIWKSTATAALGEANTTGGEWKYQVARLSKYAGATVKLRFTFTTDADGNYNTAVDGERWFGAYIDNFAVRASCAAEVCSQSGESCPSDGQGCTVDTCTAYAIGTGGVCGYQTAVLGATCTSCAQAADCGSDTCLDYTCDAGICGASLKAECCLPSSSFPAVTTAPEVAVEGFEDADISDWEIVDPFPTDNVTWSVTDVLPYAGVYTLFFGDPVAQNYDSNEDKPALATAWSPTFTLDTDPFRTPVASFWLWLSTENDGAPNPQDKFDKLTVLVQATGETPVTVWDSFEAVKGSTNFNWAQVGIDLSAFAGKSVRLGFKFDSVDASNEIGKGARIDELTVTSLCTSDGGCITANDCDDDNACTTDWCELGTCNNEQDDPLCCASNEDCDDDNACTTESCVDSLCEYAYDDGGPTCCEGPWIGAYTAGFESNKDGFTVETDSAPVTWYVADDEGFNSNHSFTFSNPTTGVYQNPAGGKSKGRLISKPVTVPPYTGGRPYAEFWYKLTTEWNDNDPDEFLPIFVIDQLKVSVAVDGDIKGATKVWVSDYVFNTTKGAWLKTRVDLDAYRGQSIQLVFAFEGDGAKDAYAGPFVDNISFNTTCKPAAAIKCIYGGNCTPANACSLVSCSDDFVCVNTPKDTPECCEPFAIDELAINFEGEPTDWSFSSCDPGAADADPTSVWQFANNDQNSTIPLNQGQKMLYFGNGTDYGGSENLGSCGTALSPEVTLDNADVPWEMTFQVYVAVEKSLTCNGGPPFSDVFTIQVEDVEAGTTTQLFDKVQLGCNDYAKWVKRTVDLSAFAGKTIRLHFNFDTFDDIDNDTAGLAVDDIQFIRGCAELP
ncbi:MAG: hypothetical protein H6744_15670 [Deltaproteobacteria bacterium]|nr:hypothetical protein [Deltaproteobacteria bacterium]